MLLVFVFILVFLYLHRVRLLLAPCVVGRQCMLHCFCAQGKIRRILQSKKRVRSHSKVEQGSTVINSRKAVERISSQLHYGRNSKLPYLVDVHSPFPVPCPKTRFEKRVLLVGGVLNILVPCGLGSIIAGCWLRDNQLISTGVLQLVLTLLIVGVIWSIVYGGLMLLSAFTVTISSPPSQPPLSTAVTPSGRMPSGSLQYQYREPQKSRYHSHAYTSLSPARVTEKSLVLAMEEMKTFSPTAHAPATMQSGTPAAEVYAKEEEFSAEATLVTQPQVGAALYHERTCA